MLLNNIDVFLDLFFEIIKKHLLVMLFILLDLGCIDSYSLILIDLLEDMRHRHSELSFIEGKFNVADRFFRSGTN